MADVGPGQDGVLPDGLALAQLTPNAADRITLPSLFGPLAALSVDPKGQRGTVVLLPGFTGSKEDFAPLLDPLAKARFRAIALDLPGQYESAGPEDEAAYAPAKLGAVCAAVIEELTGDGPPPVLLGHSFGGLIARAAVLSGARVAGVILLCSGPAAFRSGQRLDALRAGEPIIRASGKTAAYDATVAPGRAARKAVPPQVESLLRRRFLASNQASLLGMGAALQREPDRVLELRRVLSASGTPVAVIAGRADDAWTLEEQRDMAERLGTRLVIIESAAHSPAVENPVELLAVLLPLLRAWSAA